MLPRNLDIVTPAKFRRQFEKESCIAEIATEKQETAYERRDSRLIERIRRIARRHFRDPKREPYVLDDWWPNHTRYLEIVPDHCTRVFFTGLHGLLKNEYRAWRIQLCVYGDHADGNTYIGSIVLYADRILIEKKLHALLVSMKVV